MRIALVSQEYPPETAKGGIGSQTFLKAHGLSALGHETDVGERGELIGNSRTASGHAVPEIPRRRA